MHDLANGLPRIIIPRTSVNRDEKGYPDAGTSARYSSGLYSIPQLSVRNAFWVYSSRG